MRIAIVDDNEEERTQLKQGLIGILEERNFKHYELMTMPDGEEVVDYIIKNKSQLDMIFMDIYMGDLNGIETAKKIRDFDKNIKIVFISGSNEFASESYEVDAEDYLLKPFDKKRLERIIDKIFEGHEKHTDLKLPDNKIIDTNSIVITTFAGHYVTIYTSTGEQLRVRCTQKNFEKIISPYEELVPCFKGIVANLSYVDGIEADRFKMKAGNYVPISRRKYEFVKERYTTYLMRKYCRED